MKTIDLLIQKYGSEPIIPIEKVRADYFGHLTADKFNRKLNKGEIGLPVTRLDRNSRKSPKGVPLRSLASYLDKAIREAESDANAFKNVPD